MGQKVNPNGLRLGINKEWDARWYADTKDFKRLMANDLLIRAHFDKMAKTASIAKVEIERNNKRTEVTVHTARPGVIIGRGGEGVNKIRSDLNKKLDEKVNISIVDIKKPDTNAQLIADNIARQIENRASYRRAQKMAIRNAMRNGAKGIKTQVAGRLNGVDMARTEGYTEGTIPLHTLRADIDYATAEANTTFGIIGIKVWIYRGEILNKKAKGGN